MNISRCARSRRRDCAHHTIVQCAQVPSTEGVKRMLSQATQMDSEWEAWQDVGRDFKAAVGNMNDPKYERLIRGIVVWAEELHLLRSMQPDTVCDRAREQAVDRYRVACEGLKT